MRPTIARPSCSHSHSEASYAAEGRVHYRGNLEPSGGGTQAALLKLLAKNKVRKAFGSCTHVMGSLSVWCFFECDARSWEGSACSHMSERFTHTFT